MFEEIFVRSANNYDRDLASDESGLMCLDASLTRQSEAEEADINTIIRRFNVTGQLPENVRMPTFDDFSEVVDFKTAMDSIAVAREAFDAMPATVRARFHNDPQEFLEFTSDEGNRAEAVKLGLVDAEAEAAHLAGLAAGSGAAAAASVPVPSSPVSSAPVAPPAP